MSYGFLIFGDLDRPRLAAALGALFALPPEAVDVGDADEIERHWEAPISCTVTALAGDPGWSLDIFVTDEAADTPPEPVAAAWLAARLSTLLGYKSVPLPPSAFMLVEPDGRRTRARIYELDTDEPAFRVDAVERPLAALPGVPTEPLPEVIHSYRMPTPVADRVRAEGHSVNGLGAWESMITRLESGWPPDGWYPAAYYRDDLETRDELALVEEPEVAQALAGLDRRFAAATWDDGGRALNAELPRSVSPAQEWWWRRIPHPVPWESMPGR